MKLLIKQKVFAWSDTYSIYDEDYNEKYFVKAEIIALGHQLHVYDAEHNEVGFVSQKLLVLLPTFEIYIGGNYEGRIEKRFTFIHPKYDMDYKNWHVDGDVMGWDYTVYNACSPAAQITKKILRWGDTYVIDVADPADELAVVMLAVAIDAANCTKGN